MDPREQVIEDVIRRILEEHGPEAGVLDWDILEGVLEEDCDKKSKKAKERNRKSLS